MPLKNGAALTTRLAAIASPVARQLTCATHGAAVAAQATTPLGHIILTPSKPVWAGDPGGGAMPGQPKTKVEQAPDISSARKNNNSQFSPSNTEAPVRGRIMRSSEENLQGEVYTDIRCYDMIAGAGPVGRRLYRPCDRNQ